MTESSVKRRNVHPFPAKMAPDIALDKISVLTDPGAVVLDPMCGSGTVPRLALQEERAAIACDMDPLAVMMTRTSCKPDWSKGLAKRARQAIEMAEGLDNRLPVWIAEDVESTQFVEYWFAEEQRRQLGKLARVLAERPTTDDPLRIALSRLIVTKDGGASLARDTSHSRPHRVRLENSFDVFAEFEKSASLIEQLVAGTKPNSKARIRTVDARNLAFVSPASVDLVVTSPPYLNAIDYLRGHRMSLIWFGWTFSQLRWLRGEAIGAERGLLRASDVISELSLSAVPRHTELRKRDERMIWRFAGDMDRLCRSLARVVKPGGHLVFVVADSQIRGVPVSNSSLCKATALRHGFAFVEGVLRPLPAQHRYLPPPEADDGTLGSRMKEEAVLTFCRVA